MKVPGLTVKGGQAGIENSMGSRGCALDNAVCESFYASLKESSFAVARGATRSEAQGAIFAWIGWYTRRRLHSTFGYLSHAQ